MKHVIRLAFDAELCCKIQSTYCNHISQAFTVSSGGDGIILESKKNREIYTYFAK